MKTIQELVRTWLHNEQKLKLLHWTQNTFVTPRLKCFLDEVEADLKRGLITEEEEEVWRGLREYYPDGELVQLLLDLEANDQSVLSYLRQKPVPPLTLGVPQASLSAEQLN